MYFNIGVRPARSHTASSSLVRGLTNWFSDHLGACVRHVMVYPAQKNQNQIWSTEFLWHFLPICSKASTLDPSVSVWQGLSHEYRRGKITDNCFGWKWLFFPPPLCARRLLQISVNAYLQSWPVESNQNPTTKSNKQTNKKNTPLLIDYRCNRFNIRINFCTADTIHQYLLGPLTPPPNNLWQIPVFPLWLGRKFILFLTFLSVVNFLRSKLVRAIKKIYIWS